jgi:hypothetical protein
MLISLAPAQGAYVTSKTVERKAADGEDSQERLKNYSTSTSRLAVLLQDVKRLTPLGRLHG